MFACFTHSINATGTVSLFLSSLMLIDTTYISSCNVRGNKVISLFCGLLVSNEIFALFYGIQFLAGWLCFLFIIIFHRKRTAFVFKAEWKCILFSLVTVSILFLAYYFSTRGVNGHFSNFGIYLPVLLFSMSIHGIIRKEHSSAPLSTIFSSRESRYYAALEQLQQEEQLNLEFANFLHDDILQDLLSIKNMIKKAGRPDIQKIIMEALDNMNTYIRERMQDYRPAMLPKLTVKENYQSLSRIFISTQWVKKHG